MSIAEERELKMKKRCVCLLALTLAFALIIPALVGYAASQSAEGSLTQFTLQRVYLTNVYTDVPADSWFFSDVKALYEYGLISGQIGGTFRPDGVLTVVEALSLAVKAHRIYNGLRPEIITTGAQNWYDPVVAYALQSGIIRERDFAGIYTAPITRAGWLHLCAGVLKSNDLTQLNHVESVPDVSPGHIYRNDVLTLYRAGIATGVTSYGFCYPARNITRAEAAVMLNRLVTPSLRRRFTLTPYDKPTIYRHRNGVLGESISTLFLFYDGAPRSLPAPVIYDKGRLYLPVKAFAAACRITYDKRGDLVTLTDKKSASVDFKTNLVKNTAGDSAPTLVLPLRINGEDYLSLSDLCQMLSLLCDFNYRDKAICLFSETGISPKTQNNATGRAMLRLEDIAQVPFDSNDTDKWFRHRVVADYLYAQGIRYGVAWVPRYKDPSLKVDNDVSNGAYSLYNCEYVYTLDYFRRRGGTIGLHGYTHQFGDARSVKGREFGKGLFSTTRQTKERFQSAIDTAKALQIPYAFFEFPHYGALPSQFKLAEETFDVLYEPPHGATPQDIVTVKRSGKTVRYVPTPLDYLESRYALKKMLGHIDDMPTTDLAGLFFHPHLDFDDIAITRAPDGRPSVTYKSSSPLHQIVRKMWANNRRFIGLDGK